MLSKNIHERLAKSKINCIAKTYSRWIPRGTNALDIGCGNGVVANGLKNSLSISITGCDREQYLLYDIPYFPMKREDILPFDTASFDTVMFNDILHHTAEKNQKELLKEAVRVAKRNIVVFEANPTMMTYISDYLINKFIIMPCPCR